MVPLSVGRFPRGLVVLWVVVVCARLSLAQLADFSLTSAGRAFPSTESCCAGRVDYLGAYAPDGKFRSASRYDDLYSYGRVEVPSAAPGFRPREVPGFVNLQPRERVIENYEPPARARKTATNRSFLAVLRDQIITFAYGRESTLLSPQHVTVDSRGRIIVTDPAAAAVHVLDGDHSFRIAAGEHRRLWQPSGVAVDADDNIYVADSGRGIVVVYGPDGIFLRYLGKLGDESLFHSPAGIGIDRHSGRLYLLDSPRNFVFVLDLQGNILKRVGKATRNAFGRYAGDTTFLDLNEPTAIAIRDGRLAIVDSAGSRVQILDLDCNPLQQFHIRSTADQRIAGEIGLGIDAEGNIYVSNLGDSQIRVYGRRGQLQRVFGQTGSGFGEFNSPAGLWVDSANRMYIADTNNRRVQVFQIQAASPNPIALAK